MMAPLQFAAVLAQQGFGEGRGEAGGALSVLCNCFVLLLIVVPTLAGMWKTFEKAGKPGWAAIIPVYNFIVLLEIVGRPVWWIILLLIPCVGAVIQLILSIDLANSFGKGSGFGIGLFLLPFIFAPMLGFGDATYLGPSVAPPGTPPAQPQM